MKKLLRYFVSSILFVVIWFIIASLFIGWSVSVNGTRPSGLIAIGGIVAIIISYKLVKRINHSKYFLKYFNIFFIIALVGYGGFEAYNSIYFDELFSSETEELTTNKTKKITYHKSKFNGNYIIILNSFEDINIANAEVQNYISNGYKCDVFQLSGVSDSKEEIFQTYIGPFNKLQEANQYLGLLSSNNESGKVIELQ